MLWDQTLLLHTGNYFWGGSKDILHSYIFSGQSFKTSTFFRICCLFEVVWLLILFVDISGEAVGCASLVSKTKFVSQGQKVYCIILYTVLTILLEPSIYYSFVFDPARAAQYWEAMIFLFPAIHIVIHIASCIAIFFFNLLLHCV